MIQRSQAGSYTCVVATTLALPTGDSRSPTTNAWTKTALPTDLSGAAGAVLQGRLFVVGGRESPVGSTSVVATTHVYDPAGDRWITKAPLPKPSELGSATKIVVNGQARLEVVGSLEGGDNNWQYIP